MNNLSESLLSQARCHPSNNMQHVRSWSPVLCTVHEKASSMDVLIKEYASNHLGTLMMV